MNAGKIFILKSLRKIYSKSFNIKAPPKLKYEQNSEISSKIIYDILMDNSPCMIARFGSTELNVLLNYMSIQKGEKRFFSYIKGDLFDWWWNENIMNQMKNWSGFFPPTEEKLAQFCEQMIEDIKEVDVLGSWIPNESYVKDMISHVQKVSLINLEPYVAANPWSLALKNKKVLVIHPFAPLIEDQYRNRMYLFDNQDVLPEFELQTITAVQSLGGESSEFSDWFEALESMKNEIDKRDFDICLVGCGAYGFSLAAHIKRNGKKVVHLGGALQLLFGIKGNRWEATDYASNWGLPKNFYLDLMNQYWVKPSNSFKPKNAESVEGACYW